MTKLLSAAMSCSDFSTNQIGSWICPDGTHRVMSNTNFFTVSETGEDIVRLEQLFISGYHASHCHL
jgi:hypothetical protein